MVCGDITCCIHVNTIMIRGDDFCGGFGCCYLLCICVGTTYCGLMFNIVI